MARSKRWRDDAEKIARWTLLRFRKSRCSIGDYLEGKVELRDVGINRANFMKELAPHIRKTRLPKQSEDAWYRDVHGRVFYFFHKANDPARGRCYAEWPLAQPRSKACTAGREKKRRPNEKEVGQASC